jgi:hypothetical protein
MSCTVSASGLMVRDGALRLLTMRVQGRATHSDLILRSPPQAGVSKDGPRETVRTTVFVRERPVASRAPPPNLALPSSNKPRGSTPCGS